MNRRELNNYFSLQQETIQYLLVNPAATPAQIAALDANIRAIKYASGYSIGSITANMSNVASYYFLTNPSVDLRWLKGFYVRLTDSAGKIKWLLAGNTGSGETLSGTELLSNPGYEAPYTGGLAQGCTSTRGNVSQETVDIHGGSSAQGITNPAGNTGFVNQSITGMTIGALNYVTIWAKKTAGSGGRITDTNSGIYFADLPINQTIYTKIEARFTVISGKISLSFTCYVNTNASSGTNGILVDDASVQKIISPSATGIWFTPISEDAGFNPNSATFTVFAQRSTP